MEFDGFPLLITKGIWKWVKLKNTFLFFLRLLKNKVKINTTISIEDFTCDCDQQRKSLETFRLKKKKRNKVFVHPYIQDYNSQRK
mgnify:CR=1 FL=1